MLEFIPYVLIGMLAHQIKHFVQAWRADKTANFSFVGYWSKNLDTTLSSFGATAMAFLMTAQAGDMNESSAILIGVFGNTIAGIIGKRNKALTE